MKDGVLYHPEQVSLDVSSQTRVGRLTVFVGCSIHKLTCHNQSWFLRTLVAFQAHARLHSSHDDVVLFLRGQLVLGLLVLLQLGFLYFICLDSCILSFCAFMHHLATIAHSLVA
jgi:hypothetical protein